MTAATRRPRRVGGVLAAFVARRSAPMAALWGGVFGITVVSSIAGYAAAYPTRRSRLALARSLGTNPGLRAVFGPARDLSSVAGFTSWRTIAVVSVIGAVWGLLLGAKTLRGQEESGQWELVLTGPTSRHRATAATLGGLGVALLAMWATVSVVVVADGRSAAARFPVSSSLYFSIALVCSAAMFLGVGALASQLFATRRSAALASAGVLGASFLLKVVGDASTTTHWVVWCSPLGWVEGLHPLTGADPVALVPIVALLVALVASTVWIAGTRDLGASVLATRDDAAPRLASVGSATRLSWRLERPSGIGWVAGLAALGLLFGLVAKSAAQALASSAGSNSILQRLLGKGEGANLYLGFTFVLVAVLAGLVAASQLVAMRDEEAESRLDNLLVRAVTTWRWALGRAGIAVVLIVAASVAASLAAWGGAALEHSGTTVTGMLEAGANSIAAGVVVLGIGLLVYGVWPRATALVAYGLVAVSYLVELVGEAVRANHYVLDLSVLYHLEPAPAVAPDWSGVAALVAVGVAAGLLGCVALARRDLRTA